MKRLILFVLVVVLAASFLTGTYQTIYAYNDDVAVEVQHIYGDPTRVEGITTQLTTHCSQHMRWKTLHTAGSPGMTETEFTFSQEYLDTFTHDWEYGSEFSYRCSGNSGISSSGGIEIAKTGLGNLVLAVAENVQPGEAVTETVLIEDYMDYYAMDYYVSIATPMYWLDEYYDYANGSEYTREMGMFNRWGQNFRFPVLPGSKAEISLTKNPGGEICQVGVSLVDAAEVSFVTEIQEEGMYFTPVFTDLSGNSLTTGEYVYGYGLYYIPFKVDTSVEFHSEEIRYAGSFDFDGLRLVYGMDNDEQIVAMETNDDKILHLITREDGTYRYSAFDLDTGTLLNQLDLMVSDSEYSCRYQYFLEQNLIWIASGTHMALVQTGETPTVELLVEVPEDINYPNPESVLYQDGTLYMVALDWAELQEDEFERVWVLSAVDQTGLAYHGYYISSLRGKGQTYVSQDEIIFVQ